MSVVNNIYVFVTPFHLRQIADLKDVLPKGVKEIVFYNEYVNPELIVEAFPRAQLVSIPRGKVAFKSFLRQPLRERKRLLALFQAYDTIISEKISTQEQYNLVFGSEKDTFVQTLINFLLEYKIKNKIIAVDEGIAFYNNNTAKTYVLKVVYNLLSPWVFGRRVRYIYTLGSIPEIDQTYVRFLGAAQKVRRQPDKCRQILHRNRIEDFKEVRSSNKVLLLTPPLSEDNYISVEEEVAIVGKLLEMLPKSYSIHIKQHPRENQQKYDSLKNLPNLYILNPAITAEQIRFAEYGLIIHFMSSVIMELHLINYPKDRIITLDPFDRKFVLSFLYEDTIFVRLSKKKWPQMLAARLSSLN